MAKDLPEGIQVKEWADGQELAEFINRELIGKKTEDFIHLNAYERHFIFSMRLRFEKHADKTPVQISPAQLKWLQDLVDKEKKLAEELSDVDAAELSFDAMDKEKRDFVALHVRKLRKEYKKKFNAKDFEVTLGKVLAG